MFFSLRKKIGPLALSALLIVFNLPSHAQDADNRPLMAVSPIKRPNDVQASAQAMNTANQSIYDYLDRYKLDPNIIVITIEDGLRKGKKVKLFERGSAGMDAVRQEQFRAECGNHTSGASGGGLASGQTVTPKGQVVDECLKRFAGNAAATGQMTNVEFIVDVSIVDLAFGDAVYQPIPEMPGKYRRSVQCKIDISVKVLDTTTGQVKFQAVVPASYTDGKIVQSQVDPMIDWRSIWNRIATNAGRDAAVAINGAIKS